MTISSDKSKYAKLIGYLCGEQSKQIFMIQKQKLKSERVNPNVGIKDLFMTMDPPKFRISIYELAKLRDSDKPSFNLLLKKFEEHKKIDWSKGSVTDFIKNRLIRNDDNLNELLSILLYSYWICKDQYKGGYFWCMMPTKKENESDNVFRQRLHRMEDLLMDISYEVLDDLDFFIHY